MSRLAEKHDPISFEEFFAFLDKRPDTERWELIDGGTVMMTGGSLTHNLITGNIFAALRGPARERGCNAHVSDVYTSGGEQSGFLAAPDVFVRCGPFDGKARRADDPVIIVEVLSPSTIRHDRVRKFDRYTTIESVTQIVLVYQDEVRVESFVREGEEWPMVVTNDLKAALAVPFLEAELSLAGIYEGTALAA